jgi:uncharacterized phage protein (TIGR01671 family)
MAGIREIKFRAWLKKTKKMVFIEPIEMIHFLKKYRFDDGLIDDGDHFYKDEYVLMQYTGYIDRKGEYIYEGDIIIGLYEDKIIQYPVIWWKSGWYVGYDEGERRNVFSLSAVSDINVIGNIYQG